MKLLEPLNTHIVITFHNNWGGSRGYILRYTLICFSFFILSACSQTLSTWKVDSINTNNPQYNSTRLVYTDKNARLEFYRTFYKTIGYLSVTSLPIPHSPDNPTTSTLSLKIDNEEEKILTHRIEGGQKLVIPETTLYKIINAMKKQSTITLKAGRYKLVIPPAPEQELNRF
jgi:hypothetical protein